MEQKGNSNKIVWVVVALVAVALFGAAIYAVAANRSTYKTEQNGKAESTTTNQSPQTNTQDKTDTSVVRINFTDAGFAPANYTAKAGQVVEVKNASTMQLQFSSNDHPTHTEETELNLKVLAPGETATFTPTKVGTWGFHDHIHDEFTGQLTVTQ